MYKRQVKDLKDRNIKSPTGKDNWPKRSVQEMLSNEKYIGISVVNVDVYKRQSLC